MMKKEMINPLKALALAFMAFGLVFFTSCSDDDNGDGGDEPDPQPTVDLINLVRNTEGLDSLEKYLDFYPNLVATLESDGDFTLFAPNNQAFIGLLATPGFPADIRSINPDIIEGVLAYHVSTARYEAADLTAGTEVPTAAAEAITVNDDGTLFTGSSNPEIEVVEADLQATNGVMHIVGSVLIPPTVGTQLTPILGTNAGTILLGAPFSTLAAAIQKADAYALENNIPTLQSILAGDAVHTVFAPTNATFESAQIGLDAFTGMQWYGIIANHVVPALDKDPAYVEPEDLTTGATFATAVPGSQLQVFNNTDLVAPQNGLGIYLDSNGDVDLQDPNTYGNFDAEVALPFAGQSENGVVHVIAGVLVPPSAP